MSALAYSSYGEKEGEKLTEEKSNYEQAEEIVPYISSDTENFKEKVLFDIKNTFNVSLEDFTEVTPEYLIKIEEEEEVSHYDLCTRMQSTAC